MGNIAENLLALQQTKQNFKTSFESKGVDLTDVPFTEYPTKLEDLKENLDTELTEQEELLNSLEEDVNALSDKPSDRLQWKCDNIKSLYYEFYNYKGESLDEVLVGLDTSKVTDMRGMFNSCASLTSLDLSNINTKNVTDMTQMFRGDSSLTSLDLSKFDTSNVTSMYYMFYDCSKLTELKLTNFNISNVTDMRDMFDGCNNLTSLDVSNFDTSNITDMLSIFQDCKSLKSLDLSNWDTSNVTSMQKMFYYCTNLISLSTLNLVNVTSASSMFESCIRLTEISLKNTSKLQYANNMFRSCDELTTISCLDLLKTTSTSYMFRGCKKLTNLTLKNIKTNLQIGSDTSYGHLLTNESLISTIQELWDNTGNALGGSRTLTLSTTSKNNIANIYVKLVDITDEMRAEDEYIDNKKPCVVCDSTDEGAMTLTEYAISKNWAIA